MSSNFLLTSAPCTRQNAHFCQQNKYRYKANLSENVPNFLENEHRLKFNFKKSSLTIEPVINQSLSTNVFKRMSFYKFVFEQIIINALVQIILFSKSA